MACTSIALICAVIFLIDFTADYVDGLFQIKPELISTNFASKRIISLGDTRFLGSSAHMQHTYGKSSSEQAMRSPLFRAVKQRYQELASFRYAMSDLQIKESDVL